MQTLLVTGGCGFIGSNFIRTSLKQGYYRVINYDSLTYAGNMSNLDAVSADPWYKFVYGDITDHKTVQEVIETYEPDWVVNFAADSHVDRSILNAIPFINTNIVGTMTLLDACRASKTKFLQISTDEVTGSIDSDGQSDENSNMNPGNPYAASKASAELLVRSYANTYNLKTIITRCSNNYGPYQFPEKLIPLTIERLMSDQKVPIYGDGQQVRDWIHVDDHVVGLFKVLEKGRFGKTYCLSSNNTCSNLLIAKKLVGLLGKSEDLIEFVSDRPGHDRRYALDSLKTRIELGWKPRIDLDSGLDSTVKWYLSNKSWLDNIRTGNYLNLYTQSKKRFTF